ncbi:verprolin-like [Falco naumanni]|uniref:verprolin-like n=1 Tax=Falco naumanni TaxID=148594 RepID=UPI001ADE4EFD|nr:verprolin-like [Falco naumanni]
MRGPAPPPRHARPAPRPAAVPLVLRRQQGLLGAAGWDEEIRGKRIETKGNHTSISDRIGEAPRSCPTRRSPQLTPPENPALSRPRQPRRAPARAQARDRRAALLRQGRRPNPAAARAATRSRRWREASAAPTRLAAGHRRRRFPSSAARRRELPGSLPPGSRQYSPLPRTGTSPASSRARARSLPSSPATAVAAAEHARAAPPPPTS